MRKKYDWKQIQNYYDQNHTWNDIRVKFGVSMSMISKAAKENIFKSRTRSDAIKLSRQLHPIKLSEKTKQKISESRIKYLRKYPDKVPYRLNHYSKGPSYPERYFSKILRSSQIEVEFEEQKQIGPYTLDFAITNRMIDLEIDGDQHYLDTRIINSDQRRTLYLAKLGWKTIRIRWSDYQKMKNEDKKIFLKNILSIVV